MVLLVRLGKQAHVLDNVFALKFISFYSCLNGPECNVFDIIVYLNLL